MNMISPLGADGPFDFNADDLGPQSMLDGAELPTKHRARRLPDFRSAGLKSTRQRLLWSGPDSVRDDEILEILLCPFGSWARQSSFRVLIKRFGSFSATIAAPVEELRSVPGMCDAAVAMLKTINYAAIRLTRAEVNCGSVINNWDRLIEYLHALMAREPIEQFRVLFLNNRNRLLADEVQARGTVNHTPVYPREVMKRALELHATALILVHNHPSGDPTPSREDIEMTQEVKRAAEALSVKLHDHVIMGNGRWLSLRKEGLL